MLKFIGNRKAFIRLFHYIKQTVASRILAYTAIQGKHTSFMCRLPVTVNQQIVKYTAKIMIEAGLLILAIVIDRLYKLESCQLQVVILR